MSVRSVHKTRTNNWQSTTAASSTQTSTISTADPFLSVVTAPIPTLVIRFGGSRTPFLLAPSAPPARTVERPYVPPPRPPEDHAATAAPELVPDVLEAGAPDASAPEAVAAATPAAEAQQVEAGLTALTEPPPAPEPAPPAEAPASAAPDPEHAVSGSAENLPAARPNRIDLIIDSLPHHQLTEPIPVTIDPLGDEMFTASMRDLEIAATGNSIGEALLFLKEQIESTFDDLNRRLSHLSTEQKATLQMLHTYIPPAHQKSRWF